MYSPLEKQYIIMKLVLAFYDRSQDGLKRGAPVDDLVKLPARERIGRFKYVPPEKIQEEYDAILRELTNQIEELLNKKEDF
jgi:V/A-type H+-transporting ATPase subunit A